MTYDVVFGPTGGAGTGLLCFEDQADAAALAECINGLTVFQGEGSKARVVETDRGHSKGSVAELHGMSVAELEEIITEQDDPNAVRSILGTERAHPKFKQGRRGVINAAQERLAELEGDGFEEPESEDG